MRYVKLNANNNVMVRLTKQGKDVLGKYYQDQYGGTTPPWYNIDKDGWIKLRLWQLAFFGPYLYMGKVKLPFEMNMMVEIEDKEEDK